MKGPRLRVVAIGRATSSLAALRSAQRAPGDEEFEIAHESGPTLSHVAESSADAVLFLDGASVSVTAERVAQVRRTFPRVPIVVLFDGKDVSAGVELLRAGAHEVLPAEGLETSALKRSVDFATARMRVDERERGDDEASSAAEPGPWVFETDLDYYIISWSEIAQRRFAAWEWGLQPGLCFLDFLVREDKRRILDHTIRVFNGEAPGAVEYVVQNRTGVRFSLFVELAPVFDQGRPKGVRIAVLDRIARPTTTAGHDYDQETLRQTQRLEALGLLSAGVAHDLNNVLNAVSLIAAGAARDLDRDTPLAQDLHGIVRACRGGGELIQRVLRFAKAGPQKNETFSINSQIAEVEFLLRFAAPRNVEVALDLETRPALVQGDPTEIVHCLVNLCVNALHAMGDSGTLSIESRRMDGRELQGSADTPESRDCVVVRISDTGKGMTKEVLSRVADPFYSSNPEGRGTGLGLYIVNTTVRRHGGTLAIDSELGAGTTVTLCFPAAARDAEPIISAMLRTSGQFKSV